MFGRILTIILLFGMVGVNSPAAATTTQNQLVFIKHFPIANTTGYEHTPDIASCSGSDEYLVVYEKDGQIIGQRLVENGTLIQEPFEISSLTDGVAHIPRVDCIPGDPSFYVVTWLLYSVTHHWDVQIQAIHGNHQAEPASQIFGSRVTLEGGDWGLTTPEIACSATAVNCLLTFTYDGPEVEVLAQRLQVTEDGIGFLGDEFDFPMTGGDQQYTSVTWNSLDDNYLVTWHEETGISNRYGIAFTHVYAEEQGPGMNELQHTTTWLFVPLENTRSCMGSLAAFNPQTDRFLVLFSCSNVDWDDDPDLFIQRVDGSGSGLQGPPVQYLDLGDLSTANLTHYDMWITNMPDDQYRYVIALSTCTIINTPKAKLFIFEVMGSYDPASPDQLVGSVMQLGEADDFSPAGIGNPSTRRSMLVTDDGAWDGPSDIHGYLFAPYIVIFPIVFNAN